MKRKSLLTAFLAIAITSVTLAQTSTPEVPKNYKPQPKELLPMPDSLTENEIFPVLGDFTVTDPAGVQSNLNITRDGENKGIVWVSGLPQGKFKAIIKDAPATYKIPVQKTLANDETMAVAEETENKAKSKVISGRTIQEGTLIFDKDAGVIYVNIGGKYNEEHPAAIFPEMNAAEDVAATDEPAEKPAKKTAKKAAVKSITYTGPKVQQIVSAEAAAPATEATPAPASEN